MIYKNTRAQNFAGRLLLFCLPYLLYLRRTDGREVRIEFNKTPTSARSESNVQNQTSSRSNWPEALKPTDHANISRPIATDGSPSARQSLFLSRRASVD